MALEAHAAHAAAVVVTTAWHGGLFLRQLGDEGLSGEHQAFATDLLDNAGVTKAYAGACIGD